MKTDRIAGKKTNKSTITVDFKTLLSIIDKMSREKIGKNTENLSHIINQTDLIFIEHSTP